MVECHLDVVEAGGSSPSPPTWEREAPPEMERPPPKPAGAEIEIDSDTALTLHEADAA